MCQVNLYMYVRRISDLLYNVLNYLTKRHFLWEIEVQLCIPYNLNNFTV